MSLRGVVVSVVASVSVLCTTTTTHARSNDVVDSLQPTHLVTIKAPYGYAPPRITVRLSDSEWRVINRLEKISHLSDQTVALPSNTIDWRIEDSAVISPTLELSNRALQETRKLLAIRGVHETGPITVVIARTQKFIHSELAKIDCYPDLSLTQGVFVMGAAVCNYRAIVINLTGYFFYRYANQPITSAMELRAEPPLRNFSYVIADRNISGLAHEWIHIVRGSLADSFIPYDEPAWFREGLAEVVSGIARASSFNHKMNYLEFHVIRIRKFSGWYKACQRPLIYYRLGSPHVSGCEYLRGATAIELLLAYNGGLTNVIKLYRDLKTTNDFTWSFRRIYGFSLTSFEKRADVYAKYIHQAANMDY